MRASRSVGDCAVARLRQDGKSQGPIMVARQRRNSIGVVMVMAFLASGRCCLDRRDSSVVQELVTSRPEDDSLVGREIECGFLRQDVRLYWAISGWMDERSSTWWAQLNAQQRAESSVVGHPLEIHYRLVVVRSGKCFPVSWPSDLRGAVNIQTPEQAAAFLHLFSANDTYYRCPEFPFLGIVAAEDLSPSFVLHRPARMLKAEFERLGLLPTEVVPDGYGGFRIRRSVVRIDGKGNPTAAAILDERVGSNGEYTLRILWSTPLQDRSVGRSLELRGKHLQ